LRQLELKVSSSQQNTQQTAQLRQLEQQLKQQTERANLAESKNRQLENSVRDLEGSLLIVVVNML
jgi:small-conductance mechanosensitive channel